MSAYSVRPLCGVPPEQFWIVAREASTSIATVFAIAGGHTDVGGKALPIKRVCDAAKAVAPWFRGDS